MVKFDTISGESMENALRACCKGIKIGKILIHGEGTDGPEVQGDNLNSALLSLFALVCTEISHFSDTATADL